MATRERRKFTAEFKREAVKLAEQPGRSLAAVARELGVERTVLKRWVDNFAAGRYEKNRALPLKAAQQQENEQLRRELAKVRMERDILKNRPRGLPRPICVETSGGYTEVTPGQWPLAFWRHMSPSKNLAQGKLRTQLWWHCA
jgi:transposase